MRVLFGGPAASEDTEAALPHRRCRRRAARARPLSYGTTERAARRSIYHPRTYVRPAECRPTDKKGSFLALPHCGTAPAGPSHTNPPKWDGFGALSP